MGAFIAALIAGGIASGMAAAGINAISTQLTNKKNEEINQRQLDYNSAMTQLQWERDDNAHQREVADLEKAGLSPIAATGGANTSAALGAPSPIPMQAPQIQSTGILNSLLEAGKLQETERANKAKEGIQYSELFQKQEEINLKSRQLDLEDKKIQNEFEIQTRALKLQSDSLLETIRTHKENESIKFSEEERKQHEYEAEELLRYVRKHTGRDDIPYDFVTDEQEYIDKVKLRQEAYLKVLEEIENYKESSASGVNTSLSGGGSVAGTGINAGSSTGKYNSKSSDKSIYAQEKLKKFEQDYPFPIPDFSKRYPNK